ncbi:transposon Tf2-6 polyprotein [Trichonephila clavipes]|nr:transposon Tf2-6 polyprotein [Trichonephila clavipes]
MIKDKFPLPLIEEVLDKLENSKVYTSLDLKNGLFHVPMDPNSTKYISFVTHEGQYEFLRVPFGLSNSPSVFQRFIYTVFRKLIRGNILIVYMDDLLIPSQNEAEGLNKLRLVLQTAADFGLELNLKKCNFLQRKIEFLGYIIENGTIKPSPSKTQAVQNFPQPQTPRQLQSFIGLTSYFRKFIPNYARIARPLSDLLRDNVKFKFGPTEIASFQELKNILSENPVLHVFQQGYPLELHTDASSLCFGAVLLQKSDDGLFHPIHYFSHKTTVQQEKYSSYELEVLAIIEALKKFRSYLLGTKFKIITDCDAFQKTMHKKDLPTKIARWALMLEEFDYEVCHRPGRQMKHVDALSRYPIMMISSHDITQKIKEAQNKDEFISQLKSTIKITPSDEYFLKNEILYKLHKNSELLVVPEMMQREIVLHAHAQGHFASKRTESIVSQEFYIPRLTKIVQDVITNCVPCILSSRKAGKQEGFLHPIPKGDQPLDCYHCDFLGPLPSTKKCYKHLFTVIDSFSKFVWIYPVKSTSTKDALDKLILQQTIFGNPSKIITDKGSAFTSTEFQNFVRKNQLNTFR